ncbi:GntR family transcriptional regulator [Leucobacter tenebrionis]|uniref:GntR family transcriptional regulator n=1 Tax=Leucobacter tenebrionis TaxID=2873270 RepID=UPI001CA745D5|nr:GntR family transcriptional regulator [Leucobacter tenebrionis]QZY53089.1 GntR family transcriptional regulator [Leucobacter tenebrionis]
MTQTKGEEVRQRLGTLIAAAEPGHRLPPERELMRTFGVARETIRRALDDLVFEGQLVKRAGVGTFVARPRLTKQFRMRSFTEEMRAQGMSSSSRLISATTHAAGARTGAQLRISPASPVISIQRVRLANDEPMAIETLRLPLDLVPGLAVRELESRSLYETLREDYDIELSSGSQRIEATVTDDAESALLGLAPQSPALLVDRVTWTAEGRRVEAARSVYRGDRYRFEVDLTA